MTEDMMRYDLMVEGALRAVVRQSMERISAEGLPGEHHLYITFRTHEPDVRIPDYLTERYSDEMTIVLQHQYENLEVREDGFSVSLNFNNVQEHLNIPFGAISAFADPSANFGLQFKFDEAEEAASGIFVSTDTDTPAEGQNNLAPALEQEAAGKPKKSDGNVVTLDTFRKK
jgi:hypothetical protein